MSESCEYTNGKPCYYDGSGLAAEDCFKELTAKGDQGVWNYLEQQYIDTFGELK